MNIAFREPTLEGKRLYRVCYDEIIEGKERIYNIPRSTLTLATGEERAVQMVRELNPSIVITSCTLQPMLINLDEFVPGPPEPV